MSPDQIEISDGLTVQDIQRLFDTLPKPIDSADRRLQAWSDAAAIGSNMARVDGVLYSWDTKPRRQKNGAVIGRVYAQNPGGITHDVGAYKIAAGGEVLQVPAALRAVLPGAEGAEASADADQAGDAS